VVLLHMRFHRSSVVDPELCVLDPDSTSQVLPDPNLKLGTVKKVDVYVPRMKYGCALSTKISTTWVVLYNKLTTVRIIIYYV
jgi:hypothetical protein